MRVIRLIRSAAGTISDNAIVLRPLYLLLFFYLAALELLYFIPFEPLKTDLGPVVRKLFGDLFLHYPHHLLLLPRLFEYAQLGIYLFCGSFCIPLTVLLAMQVYRDETPSLKRALRRAVKLYPLVFLLLSLMMTVMVWKTGLLDMLVQRALRIRSAAGGFAALKKMVIFGAPYLNLFLEIVVQSLFVAAIPALIRGPGRISAALAENFQLLQRHGRTVFGLILVPSLLHVPVHLLRATGVFTDVFPETTVLLLAAGAVVNVIVDALVYTGLIILLLTPKDRR